jgi:hypothetical protein
MHDAELGSKGESVSAEINELIRQVMPGWKLHCERDARIGYGAQLN